MANPPVAYDPNSTLQQSFLASLALGESGSGSSAYTTAYNGTSSGASTVGASTDQYGFPTLAGADNSHAAGAFQFEPGTWDPIASQYGLNFSNPQDQNAGAWYLAQQKDPNLVSDLSSGNYANIQTLLASTWPSVTGNGAAPQGLAHDLASGIGNSFVGASGSLPPGSSSASGSSSSTSTANIFSNIENFFVRFGLIIVGGIVVIVALWQLLSSQGIVPSPSDTVKAGGEALKTAALAA